MSHYSVNVRDAREAFTKLICTAYERPDFVALAAQSVDMLNKAFDELTDYLVRQREERDRIIQNLINEVAEAKHQAELIRRNR